MLSTPLQTTDTVEWVIPRGDSYCFVLRDQVVDACEDCEKQGTLDCNIHSEEER